MGPEACKSGRRKTNEIEKYSGYENSNRNKWATEDETCRENVVGAIPSDAWVEDNEYLRRHTGASREQYCHYETLYFTHGPPRRRVRLTIRSPNRG
jgi:hypothetical protein